MTCRALAEVNKGINLRNIYQDKSVFILRRGFEHIVELRRRTEAGKDLIKGRFYPAITPWPFTDALSVISQFRKNWENVIVNLKNNFLYWQIPYEVFTRFLYPQTIDIRGTFEISLILSKGRRTSLQLPYGLKASKIMHSFGISLFLPLFRRSWLRKFVKWFVTRKTGQTLQMFRYC